jgi:hypothetical protein
MKTLAELEAELAIAIRRRQDRELSDDFCYTNGTIQPYLQAEARLRREIKQRKAQEQRP